jgi:hypothetical protein
MIGPLGHKTNNIIGWVENKQRGSDILYNLFRKETLKQGKK